MKKKLALLLSLVLLCAISVGGVTYAYFTSFAVNNGNTFTTGTVEINIKRDNSDYVPGPMFYSSISDTNSKHKFPYDAPGELPAGWAPGDQLRRNLIIESEGSIDAKLTNISVNIPASYVASGGNTISGVTSGDAYNGYLDNMYVTVKDTFKPDTVLVNNIPLRGFLSPGGYTLPTAYSLGCGGSESDLEFTVYLSKDADNSIQGKNIIVDFNLTATQDT